MDGPANLALHAKNRVAWNRWMASSLDAAARDSLRNSLHKHRDYIDGEFEPLSDEELKEQWELIGNRGLSKRSYKDIDLQADGKLFIDFDATNFEDKCNFRGFYFPRRASFDGSVFVSEADFTEATFEDYGSFEICHFQKPAEFCLANFRKWAPFQYSKFSSYANFGYANFSGGADFSECSIQGHADFNHATIRDSARFRRTEFSDRAIFYAVNFGYAAFQKAVFADGADFDHAHFNSWVDFQGAKFSSAGHGLMNLHYRFREEQEEREGPGGRHWHGASFRAVTFSRRVDFENVEFSASSSFSNTTFEAEPPLLLGATFHEGTEWRGTKWPLPKSAKDAGTFIDAYACLKLEMDRLKKHEDELDFFALELQSRSVFLGPWKGLPITLYGWFCDFGRSYTRPLWGLFVIWISFLLPFWMWLGQLKLMEALGLSLANTFGVLGFRKELISTRLLDEMPGILKFLAGTQTVLGAAFLFLFALALRNKFRMK